MKTYILAPNTELDLRTGNYSPTKHHYSGIDRGLYTSPLSITNNTESTFKITMADDDLGYTVEKYEPEISSNHTVVDLDKDDPDFAKTRLEEFKRVCANQDINYAKARRHGTAHGLIAAYDFKRSDGKGVADMIRDISDHATDATLTSRDIEKALDGILTSKEPEESMDKFGISEDDLPNIDMRPPETPPLPPLPPLPRHEKRKLDDTYEWDAKGHENESPLLKDIAYVLNKHNVEGGSNTPDFILAQYLHSCLRAFNTAIQTRANYYNK